MEGPFACATGETCTFAYVAESLDDRVEVFRLASDTAELVGIFDFDLKPNPMGDYGDGALDEPFGATVDRDALYLSVGHYPTREAGSVLRLPWSFLAGLPVGEFSEVSRFFADSSFNPALDAHPLPVAEGINLLTVPEGRVLIAAFGNDLFAAETSWTQAGELLILDPSSGDLGRVSLDAIDDEGCAGAWGMVALDDDANRIAIACDGEPSAMVMLDLSGVGEATPTEAAAAVTGCAANLSNQDRRTRHLAPDGEGGVWVADSPSLANGEAARLWHFGPECAFGQIATWENGVLWDLRSIVPWPGDVSGALVLNGAGAEEGVLLVDAEGERCGRLEGLDGLWPDDQGPLSLARVPGQARILVTTGPDQASETMPGAGKLLDIALRGAANPCTLEVESVRELDALLPAVDEADPKTWRRAPSALAVWTGEGE